jgi:hypothetical protein
VHGRPQEIPVTLLGHPARTSEVAVVHATGAFSVLLRVDPEKDTNDLRPLGTFFGRVEKSDIECEVLSVVVRHTRTLRRLIGKHDSAHSAGLVLGCGFASVHA